MVWLKVTLKFKYKDHIYVNYMKRDREDLGKESHINKGSKRIRLRVFT